MELQSDFEAFLKEVRPTDGMRSDLQTGHKALRERLQADTALGPLIVSDFLQGSYRRYTAVRPKNGKRSDVDVIVVTKLAEAEYSPAKAMGLFEPFLKKYYSGKWRRQGRSFGIELSYVELDLVITSAPSVSEYGILQSEAVTTNDDIVKAADWRLHRSWLSLSSREGRRDAERLLAEAKSQPEWQIQPLRIPDRDANVWADTHPLEQIRWTREKNKLTGGHFVNVVKAIKWWRLENHEQPEHPKGFPLERLIGEHCPDGIGSVAEGIVETLEAIDSSYRSLVSIGGKPALPDYGVPGHDVLKRVSGKDFAAFHKQVVSAATLARRAYDSQDRTESGKLWRELLGGKFPEPPSRGSVKQSGYSAPEVPAVPGSGRFA